MLTDYYQITMGYAYWKAGKMQDIAVRYCPTTGMLADILTKQVALRPFQYLTGRIFNRIPRAD